MASSIPNSLSPAIKKVVKESKILLVGSGGIGCEVLKNLVMLGFSDLEVIDLDTIEVSNLNRQFLFQQESVGKAKSIVARESVLKFNKNVNITAHVGDITDQKYGNDFYQKFKLIINALDNRKARAHVNRMCLSSGIPLIESGIEGYSGQVEIMFKGKTPCYECVAKPAQKTYPMCTIRNTPKEPIHCIVWAKFLFGELFGETEENVSMDQVLNSDQDNLSVADDYTKMSTRDWAVKNSYDSEKLLKKIFFDDIHFMINKMPLLYKDKSIKPVPLDEKFLKLRSDYKNVSDEELMDLQQNVTMFLDSIVSIHKRLLHSNNHPLIWDKDDDDFMNFVVSSANIRAVTFNITILSRMEIKTKAGNIIPAIATANAIIGGLISIHALRMLVKEINRCQTVYLRQIPNYKGGLIVKIKKLDEPNKKCNVCSEDGLVILITDSTKMTIRQFEELVLKSKLNIVAPDVIVEGNILISSNEEDKVDNYSQYLSDFNIRHGSIFFVEDYFQNFSIKVKLHHKDWTNEEDDLFEIFANEDDIEKKSKNKRVYDNNSIIDNDPSSDVSIIDELSNEGDNQTGNNDNTVENISTVDSIIVDEDIAVNKDVVDEDITDENLVTDEIKKRKAEDEGIEESKKICVE